jgi:hypothetical protein
MAAEDPGGFVMSAQLRDLSTVCDERNGTHAEHTSATHPRGPGFRILSRIARNRAAEEPEYAPRHRLDAEPDFVPSVTH